MTKTIKLSVSSASLYLETKYWKSKFSSNFKKSTSLKTKCLTKDSDQSGISSKSSGLSNNPISSFTFVECQKATEQATLTALQVNEQARQNIELLEKQSK